MFIATGVHFFPFRVYQVSSLHTDRVRKGLGVRREALVHTNRGRKGLGVRWEALVHTDRGRKALGVRREALVHTDRGRRGPGVRWRALVHTGNVPIGQRIGRKGRGGAGKARKFQYLRRKLYLCGY